ncbi:MAG: glycosyltransferase [Candidatus Latescibacteria bacterium]|nr:glycosyltransferase [Candidatus Latescibacterota bacterium]
MKISLLCMDLSNNCLGRSYLLAKALQPFYEVEIVGPQFRSETWSPVAQDTTIPFKRIIIDGVLKPFHQLMKISNMIEGDVIYASKPILSSLGVGLLHRWRTRKPLILDIDDWQLGHGLPRIRDVRSQLGHLLIYHHFSYWNAMICEKLIRSADQVTVSNPFLQRKYGGTLVPHGKDTVTMDPVRYNRAEIRRGHHIDEHMRVVMFYGTPRRYKGIEHLIEAVRRIDRTDVMLMVAGLTENDDYCDKLRELGTELLGDRFLGLGEWRIDETPELISISDIAVVPQSDHAWAQGQTPAKVFDAMAMAKPVIATAVSDLPEILHGCGWVIPPDYPGRLSDTIEYVLSHPEEATEAGQKARQRCLEKYSWKVVGQTLRSVFARYE